MHLRGYGPDPDNLDFDFEVTGLTVTSDTAWPTELPFCYFPVCCVCVCVAPLRVGLLFIGRWITGRGCSVCASNKPGGVTCHVDVTLIILSSLYRPALGVGGWCRDTLPGLFGLRTDATSRVSILPAVVHQLPTGSVWETVWLSVGVYSPAYEVHCTSIMQSMQLEVHTVRSSYS